MRDEFSHIEHRGHVPRNIHAVLEGDPADLERDLARESRAVPAPSRAGSCSSRRSMVTRSTQPARSVSHSRSTSVTPWADKRERPPRVRGRGRHPLSCFAPVRFPSFAPSVWPASQHGVHGGSARERSLGRHPRVGRSRGLLAGETTKKKSRFPNWESGSRIRLVVGRTLTESGPSCKGAPRRKRRATAESVALGPRPVTSQVRSAQATDNRAA